MNQKPDLDYRDHVGSLTSWCGRPNAFIDGQELHYVGFYAKDPMATAAWVKMADHGAMMTGIDASLFQCLVDQGS